MSHESAPFHEKITGKIVETRACVYGENGMAMATVDGVLTLRLGDCCVIQRSAGLSRIRGTIVPVGSAYISGHQGINLTCQITRSLTDRPERWTYSPRSTRTLMSVAPRQRS